MLLAVEGLGPDVPAKTPVIVFLIPIVLSAYVGGLASGLLSTALAVLTTAYFLLPPNHSWYVTSRTDVVKLVTLAALGGFSTFVMESRRCPESKLPPLQGQSFLPSTERKVRVSFVFLLTCLVGTGAISYFSVVRLREDVRWVDHSHRVIASLRRLQSAATDTEASARGYIITGQNEFLKPYPGAVDRVSGALGDIRSLTAENAVQQHQLDRLQPLLLERLTELSRSIGLRRGEVFEAAQQAIATGNGERTQDRIDQLIGEMEGAEQRLLQDRDVREGHAVRLTKIMVIGTGLLAVILGGIAQFLIAVGFNASRLTQAELEQLVRERTVELAQANEQLRESRDRLHVALEAASAGAWEWDLQTNANVWSEELWKVYGLEPYSCEPSYETWRQLIHPDDLPGAEQAVQEAARQGIELSGEWRVCRSDGTERWLISRGHPILNADGRVGRFLGIVLDITERKLAEETRSRFAAIVESSDDAIIGKTLDGVITSWNAGAQRLYGFTSEEAVGQPISFITPPDREEETKQILSTIAAGGSLERLDSVRLRKDGTQVEVSMTVSPIRDAAGKIIGASAIAHDITERKRAEQQRRLYDLLVHRSRDIILFVRQNDGRIVGANAAAERAYGYSQEELLALSLYDLRPSESPEAIRAQLDESDLHGLLFEATHRCKDGSAFPVEVSSRGETIEGTRTLLSVVRDISERKRMEDALRESEARVSRKLESVLAPEGDIGKLELADVIDVEAFQLLMDDLHKLTQIPMAIVDLKGKVLVGVGWQEICTRFHRVHPETGFHCFESDTQLSSGIAPGEFRMYKCKNNMCDVATPILVGGRHLGNLFMGQFFPEGEPLDRDLFRSQAARYGFEEGEYITALEAVPRLTQEKVNTGMAFFMRLADVLSKLSYGNLKLARLLAERDTLVQALRESEAQFRTLANAIPQLSWMANADGWLFWYNERWYEYTGTTPEQMEGWGWQSVHEPEELPKVLERWKASIATGKPFDMIFPLRGSDGVFRPFLTRGVPVHDREGKVVRWFGTNTDVSEQRKAEDQIRQLNEDLERRVIERTTQLQASNFELQLQVAERKRAEEQIRELNRELEDRNTGLTAANKELEAFAYSVSHDLRAPVRHLSAFSESLRKRSYEELDERARHYLDNIGASSRHMGTLIDDLLKFSRLGRAAISKARVDLEPLVQEVRRELEPDAVGRNIVWQVSGLPEVYADPALLRQVFVNLMSNAVKYTRGRQETCIEVGCTNGTPGERVIFIRDNGVGFEMEYVDKLFKVFQRLHTDEFEGTGIGLANVRRIIERHGGRVWAKGVPEQGATFYFSIPTRGET